MNQTEAFEMGLESEAMNGIGYLVFSVTTVFVGASLFLMLDQFGSKMLSAATSGLSRGASALDNRA